MIVIAKEAETKLLEELQACREDHPTQRCLYMAFSAVDVPKKELFESFLKLLHEVPDAYNAQVFICQDRDVFILMQGFMQRHFTDFLKTLAAELHKPELVNLGDIMEVGLNWTKLDTMCQRKMEKIRNELAKETEEKRKEEAEKATLEIMDTLDPGEISSIARRRAKRTSPVVMVVDDDQIVRTLVGNVLREKYDWTYAKDGQGALREYVASAPDVLFLDIGLPDINGHDVLESIFQMDPDAHIIMFSSHKDKQNIMRALEAGAKGFIGKPFTRDKLFQYIDRAPHLAGKRERGGVHAGTI